MNVELCEVSNVVLHGIVATSNRLFQKAIEPPVVGSTVE